MEHIGTLLIMIFSEIVIGLLFLFLRKQKRGQIKTAFLCFLCCLFIWDLSLIFQILCQNLPIDPFFFEKFAGIGAFLSPVAFFFLGKVFSQTKVKLRWYHALFFVIPVISIILAFTNDYHHWFVKEYSIYSAETKWGPYFIIHSIYSYALYAIGIWYFIRYTLKNSGFFSKQSILIIVGTLIPFVINILGTFGVAMTVYLPQISFSVTAVLYSLAIFKFKFLSITPIALQKIVDRISDSYIVLNEDNIITDFNYTFLNVFHLSASDIRNKDLFSLLEKNNIFNMNLDDLHQTLETVKNSDKTFRFEKKVNEIDKYFIIEINSIRNKKEFLGTLMLFKDTTQHMHDIQTIKNNQDMLMEKERLASLGQLIGGIAHNLKTPIMSISGAAEGLSDLVKEYDASIGDPEVTQEDHHDIAKDMSNWISKIREYTEYMSDVITAVKGQAVTLSSDQNVSFTIDELVKRVNILMKHELKNALIDLNIDIKIDSNTVIQGDVNSLVQVINNMISNSIQAYNGKPNESIEFIIAPVEGNKVSLAIQDHGMGMSKEVQQKLFKEMITTKGKNGTGLGLFMSYSTIKAHFRGDIRFESKKGEGTTFYIVLPLQ